MIRNLWGSVLIYVMTFPLWGASGGIYAGNREPILILSPDYIYFGNTLVGNGYSRELTLSNSGSSDLTLTGIELSGSEYFFCNQLPELPLILHPGDACSMVVNYYPQYHGSHHAGILITSLELDPVTYNVNGQAFWSTIQQLPYACEVPINSGWETVIRPPGTSATISGDWITLDEYWGQWAKLTTSTSPGDTLILCSPGISPALIPSTMQFSFRAAASVVGQSLIIGMMDSPFEPMSFSPLDTLYLDVAPSDFMISLAGYTGSGRYIAFRHGLGGFLRDIYIRSFVAEYIPQTDLQIVDIIPPRPIPMYSQAVILTRVFNRGSQAIPAYVIKLFDDSNVEIVSCPGIPLLSGETRDVPIAVTVNNILRCRTELFFPEDQNNLNNQSKWIDISVLAPGYNYTQIGDCTELNRIPLDFYAKNSLFETILSSNEIGMTGQILSLVIPSAVSSGSLNNKPITVWMGEVTESDLSGGWIPSQALTLVFDGSVSI